ncbi:hypothetical protein SVAN01_06854 [Stagonosporopsis vannaccii]|nr:hypothetical protein SVAN01_06854 [Stagonosporopsis vannaccii]
MPFPRNIFTRKTQSEGKLSPEWSKEFGSPNSPKSPKSPRSSKSPKSPRTPKSPRPLTATERNTEYLEQCVGCDFVADFVRRNVAYSKPGEVKLPATLLHNSFEELENCARKCQICRVFRQALLLEEVTFDDVKELKSTKGKVMVGWPETAVKGGKSGAYLTVKVEDRPGRMGVINCNNKNDIAHLALRPDARDIAVLEQATEWLHTCLDTHIGDCDNLRFSRETPKLLIEIISPDLIRLCENVQADYVALSYCWGIETDEVRRGKTIDENLDARRKPFSAKELPATVRHALYIVHAMGVRYAWVDSLCINQSTSEGVEMMHKVYSNALFTICACATSKAISNLLDRREAWTMRTEPCQLGGQWLTTSDMSLNELRLRSPLAARAWTLQEERLSPRMLYVSSSRLYWSCARGCEVELAPAYGSETAKVRRPVFAESDRIMEMPLAQEFLMACYNQNQESGLHDFWADIVKSYALRTMSHRKDRLNALSGLAAKYLSANAPDEYLAGIWAKNLPEGLVWRVQQAAENASKEVDTTVVQWPSWSWASLPLQTAIETKSRSARSAFFRRITSNDTMSESVVENIEKSVKKGVNVKELRVRGRLRVLWKSSSQQVKWSGVSRLVDGVEKFTFSIRPEQNMHAIQTDLGRVLVYEDRQKEVVGQLDFRHDVSRAERSNWMALEIGNTTMLLLEACGKGVFRRIGVAWDVRNNYFALAELADVALR